MTGSAITILGEDLLIQAARRGDLEAFNQLVLIYQGQVYALACRLLGDRDAAADIAQETFLSAFQHIAAFRHGYLRAWLLRIATNLCYDALRRQKSRPSSSLDIAFTQSEGSSLEPTDEEDPEAYAERQELAREIQQALTTLPPEQRLVVILCDIDGLPYAEAAQAAGISTGTLKSRLSRGRARLRDYFLQRRELLPASLRSILGSALPSPPATAPEE